ncbi:MAG: hypothetical protein EA380_06170 [Phycisphaeraceae bacterium]|nr:MAG: hypothetical protein EA380_06170 [Phycisphaeraceae bacterium]
MTTTARRVVTAVLGMLVCVLATGCLELTGQRFSIWYDKESDELSVLIWYDGPHSPQDVDEAVAERMVSGFLGDGTKGAIMLFNSYAMIGDDFFDQEEAEEVPYLYMESVNKFVAKIHSSVDRKILGMYRDPQGRVGVAQLVTVRGASELLPMINAMINDRILLVHADMEDAEEEAALAREGFARTNARIVEAAQRGHDWVTITKDGLVLEVPVDRAERSRLRAMIAVWILESARYFEGEDWKHQVRSLASLPISISDHRNSYRLTLSTDAPLRIRTVLRGEYDDNLAHSIERRVRRNLDLEVGAALMGDAAADIEASLIVEYGHPEDHMRALLAVARDEEHPLHERAWASLGAWSERWNRDVGHPESPLHGEVVGRDALLDAWNEWHIEILQEAAISGAW